MFSSEYCEIFKNIYFEEQLRMTASTRSEFFFLIEIHAFFIGSNFISNARLKMAKNLANGKQHPEAKILLFEDYSHSSSTLSSKNNGTYSKE